MCSLIVSDRAIIHPDMPHLHIIHPLPASAAMTWPPTEESSSQLIDALAPAVMRVLDLAFDAVRRADGNKGGGWNLLMTL
jgi:ATP adenylyltransferase